MDRKELQHDHRQEDRSSGFGVRRRGIALTAPAQAASAPPNLPPAAIPPPQCIPQSQYDQPYEWEYQLTKTLGKDGHGFRTHMFAIYYAPSNVYTPLNESDVQREVLRS
ncbi:hypothetical protein [Nonomuraea helvata]|uniref:Uncharacterized protein n=1 Tax=Nonomuraea helvata TaxID=37484 RepID=A0ABV5SCK9_9ACTN